jgi:hypothetical protein
MKNFIFIRVLTFTAFLMLSGCYTYLSLSEGAKLADVPSELMLITDPGSEPDPCPCPDPRPIIVTYYQSQNPPAEPYQRPKEISELRDGGESRIPNDDGRRR